MKPEEQLLEAMSEVGLDLVDMAEKLRMPKSFWRRTLPVAACAILMLGAGLYSWMSLHTPAAVPGEAASSTPAAYSDTADAEQTRILLASQESAIDMDNPRSTNVALACQALDGLVLLPGSDFSFNDTVGERTAEKGYVAASVYGSGTGEIGGGIGQAASMLYCATLKLDLEQLERAGNTYAVDYVDPGLDAAVYWDITDYRFRNSLSHPLEIRASVEDGVVTVALWGSADDSISIALESIAVEDTIVETFQNFLDENGNVTERRSLGITVYEPLPD